MVAARRRLPRNVLVLVPVQGPFYAASELGVQTHFLSIEDQLGDSRVVGRFAVRGMLVLGVWH